MSCNSLNRQPEKYRLTVPSKGGFFFTNSIPPNYYGDFEHRERIINNIPTTCSRCSGTFLWGSNSNHNNCFENCNKQINYKIDGCAYENSLFRPRTSNLGCQLEPSSQGPYTNVPLISGFSISPNCGPKETYNPPNNPGYIQSGKRADLLEYNFGREYSY
jgi:hypothetical protein